MLKRLLLIGSISMLCIINTVSYAAEGCSYRGKIYAVCFTNGNYSANLTNTNSVLINGATVKGNFRGINSCDIVNRGKVIGNISGIFVAIKDGSAVNGDITATAMNLDNGHIVGNILQVSMLCMQDGSLIKGNVSASTRIHIDNSSAIVGNYDKSRTDSNMQYCNFD